MVYQCIDTRRDNNNFGIIPLVWRLDRIVLPKSLWQNLFFFNHKVCVGPKSFLVFFAASLSMANPPEYVGCQGQRTEVITPIKWLMAPWWGYFNCTQVIRDEDNPSGFEFDMCFFEGTCF